MAEADISDLDEERPDPFEEEEHLTKVYRCDYCGKMLDRNPGGMEYVFCTGYCKVQYWIRNLEKYRPQELERTDTSLPLTTIYQVHDAIPLYSNFINSLYLLINDQGC